VTVTLGQHNAKTMFQTLRTHYSILNGPGTYKLWSDLSSNKQEKTSVMVYYARSMGIWDDFLSLSLLYSCDYEKGAKTLSGFENLRTCQFLMGLDDDYATFCTQIVNMTPLPDLDRVYATVM